MSQCLRSLVLDKPIRAAAFEKACPKLFNLAPISVAELTTCTAVDSEPSIRIDSSAKQPDALLKNRKPRPGEAGLRGSGAWPGKWPRTVCSDSVTRPNAAEPGYRLRCASQSFLASRFTSGARGKDLCLACEGAATIPPRRPIIKSTQNAGRASEREADRCAERAGRARD
jgi:hypothetical protein